MNEINVVVNQEPGKVTWNFEEIKSRLQEDLKIYQNTAYTDDTIKTAKGDVAELRKLAAAIEDRQKEIKEECLKPYAVIEAQAKELVSLIDQPINAINEQVKDYERRRKERVQAEIFAYYQNCSGDIPEQIREKVYQNIYDTKWENATATKKSWKEGIEKGISDTVGAIETIRSFKSEFESDILTVYYDTLSLQSAMKKMNELNVQKERILEQERKRREAEEAERKRQEEKKQRREELARQKIQEEQQQREAQINQGHQEAPGKERTVCRPDISGRIPQPQTAAQMGHQGTSVNSGIPGEYVPHLDEPVKIGQNPKPETKAYPNEEMRTVRILGTKEQITKILNYIRFTGATYEEV